MKKRLCTFLMVFVLLVSCALPAMAAPAYDPNKSISLTIQALWEKAPLENAQVTLHRVADITETSPWITFTLSGAFEDYPVELKDLDNDGWKAAASTLAIYATKDKIEPTAQAVVDKDGNAVFHNLTAGLYLVQMVPFTDEVGYTYKATPVLMELPEFDDTTDTWNYTATARLKLEKVVPQTELTVQKVWNNGSMTQPKSIKVALLCDGVEKEVVELNSSNNWRHTFKNLDATKTWTVVEVEVPHGYTVTYTTKGTVITITNTGKPSETPEPPTPPTATPPGGLIPQTGVLWWPVPVMALAGLILFVLGWHLRWGKRNDR